ncbi:MAG: hypothetical protein J5759_04845 [Bacteroidales bacterium]|nr:hypothetical protein [Bacteroidales bacterium]
MKRLLCACVALLACAAAASAQDWGGHYRMDVPGTVTGDLYLVPVDFNTTDFLLVVSNPAGDQIVYSSSAGPVALSDGSFVWRYPSEDIDYSISLDLDPVNDEDVPMMGFILVTESLLSENPPYKTDLSPNGIYKRDDRCFVTPDGWMYRIADNGSTCTLACGGRYSDAVQLPQSVKGPFGRYFRVTGVDADAFRFSKGITQVNLYDDSQQLAPGSLFYTDIQYDWESSPKPYFAYPDKSRTRFVIPGGAGFKGPEGVNQWVIFKQNLAPAQRSGSTVGVAGKREGRVDQDFDSTMGVFYTLQSSSEDIARMFRGYNAMEIEALVADPWFVAHHTFPAFGRWKYPEKEVSAPKSIETAMSRRVGRPVMYSRKAAWLREGKGELDIVEFEHVNHQAMVAFVWQDGKDVLATCTLTTDIESEYEDYSVWNVDDDGHYGIPDVVTIALDAEGAVTVFLAKNSPESVTCFALHQQGDTFERVALDQWYRFVDL